MKKLFFIFNLNSGKAVIGDMLGDVLNEFTKDGYEVTTHPTQGFGDTANATEYACKSGFDVLVCAGGDGTLSECINGLMRCEEKIPVGYIPTGSTNDFARTLGIPKSVLGAVQWIIEGTPTLCDVGKFNDQYFTYITAFGAFANVAYETPQQIKNIFGYAAYLMNGLTQLTSIRSKRMRVEYDDNVIEDDFVFGMITNSASVAGLLSFKDFALDDGVFEVTLIKRPANLIQLNKIMASLLNINEDINREYIRFFRTSSIKFTSLNDEAISWTRDGEYGGDSAVNIIESCPLAVPFILGSREHADMFTFEQLEDAE